MAVPKDPTDLEIAEPFRSLFPIDPAIRDLVLHSIRDDGYDPSKPILAWRDAFGEHGRTVIVDGHTRVDVAIELKLDAIPVTMRRFANVDEAWAAAIGEQARRRNLNPSQLAVHVLTALERLGDHAGGQGARNDLYGRSARELGELLGVTSRTIERARQLIGFGDDELVAQVRSGEIGLKTAIEHAKRSDDIRPGSEVEVEPEDEVVFAKVQITHEPRDRFALDKDNLTPADVAALLHADGGTRVAHDISGPQPKKIGWVDGDDIVIAVDEHVVHRQGRAKTTHSTGATKPTPEDEPPYDEHAEQKEGRRLDAEAEAAEQGAIRAYEARQARQRQRPQPGETVRKGVHERARTAETALRLMWWEFELDLPKKLEQAEASPAHTFFGLDIPAETASEARRRTLDTFDDMVNADSTLAGMLDQMHNMVVQARGGAKRQELVEKLRNTAGRTPAEQAMFEAKADEIEANGTAS